jgi:glycosyltransferase involved in cell wall biosynthesis
MRVALVGPVHPYRGGVSQFTTRLATEIESRHDLLVISWRRQYPGWLYPGGDQLAAELPAGNAPGPRFVLDYRSAASVLRAARLIRQSKPDLVVLTWITTFVAPYYLLMLWLLRRSLPRGTRIIAICHNVLPHEQRPFDRALAAGTLSRVDAAIVHAQAELGQLARIAPRTRRIALRMPEFGPVGIHPEPHAEDLRRRERLGDRVILFFGYVRAYKGLAQLLEAMPAVLEKLAVDVVVVGQFWEPKEPYLALIERLGIGDRVHMVDRYVPDDEVADWFAVADAVVLPYVSATQSAVAALAFQQGRPVISTEVGGIPEAVEDGVTGLIVPPHDPAALADAIVRFYQEDLSPRFSAAIAAMPSDSWRRYVDGLTSLAGSADGGPP